MYSTRTPIICLSTLLPVLFSLFVWTSQGFAETSIREGLQITQGRELAQLWCRNCHLIDREGAGYVQSGVPTFVEIADRTGQTRQGIKLFLVDPHPPMPNLNLSRDEIENLTSYILSLREENAN